MTEAQLGKCCVCEKEGKTVRHIMTLPRRGPGPGGHGWGCHVCNLPPDGAIAVVCDACFDAKKEIKFVCDGYPVMNQRVPIESLAPEEFDHDQEKHEEWSEWALENL